MQVRDPKIDFTNTPIHYFGGRPFPTHLCNALSLLFPAGERYFIRNVNRYGSQLKDPELKKQLKQFFGQEGMHALEHERFFQVLRDQGFKIDPYLKFYEFLAYKVIAPLEPAVLSLSVTAAMEHFTAMMAEHMLGSDLLAEMDPKVRELYLWHAAEELEHKSVAYDVLQQVNPSYFLRIVGLISASAKLTFFWLTATFWMLMVDPKFRFRDLFTSVQRVQNRYPIGSKVFLTGLKEYAKRDFHPDQNDNYHLAEKYFATHKMS